MQTDGYKVYDYFESLPGVIPLSCMAHIRRKFIEAQRSHPGFVAKALEYAYKLWPRVRRYADDGRYQLDNNPVERG